MQGARSAKQDQEPAGRQAPLRELSLKQALQASSARERNLLRELEAVREDRNRYKEKADACNSCRQKVEEMSRLVKQTAFVNAQYKKDLEGAARLMQVGQPILGHPTLTTSADLPPLAPLPNLERPSHLFQRGWGNPVELHRHSIGDIVPW